MRRARGCCLYRHSEHEGLPSEETCGESDFAWRSVSNYAARSTSMNIELSLVCLPLTSEMEHHGYLDLVSRSDYNRVCAGSRSRYQTNDWRAAFEVITREVSFTSFTSMAGLLKSAS